MSLTQNSDFIWSGEIFSNINLLENYTWTELAIKGDKEMEIERIANEKIKISRWFFSIVSFTWEWLALSLFFFCFHLAFSSRFPSCNFLSQIDWHGLKSLHFFPFMIFASLYDFWFKCLSAFWIIVVTQPLLNYLG